MSAIYPKLSKIDVGFFRFGGAGLANCMFVAARAFLLSEKTGLKLLRPSWERFGVGQFVRKEKDKRLYRGLFLRDTFCENLKKLFKIAFLRKYPEAYDGQIKGNALLTIEGLGNYFKDILDDHSKVCCYFNQVIAPNAIAQVPQALNDCIALHVRLGDFNNDMRVDIQWYKKIVCKLLSSATKSVQILLFSDGSDEELIELLTIPQVKRVFYGNALADIIAISRCSLLIGSDSTFCGWGAYLGQVPSIFAKVHYGNMLIDDRDLLITGNASTIPENFLQRLISKQIL